MTTPDAPSWLDSYGPAEYDKRRCPKSARDAAADQGALFIAARTPLPAKAADRPQLDGQEDLFGDERS